MSGVINLIEKLDKDYQPKFIAFWTDVKYWIPRFEISETLRTLELQKAYFAQGRKGLREVNGLRALAGVGPLSEKENSYTITKCDGLEFPSNHQSGQAMDCVPLSRDGRRIYGLRPEDKIWLAQMQFFGQIARNHGFVWGGDWKSKPDDVIGWDPWHIEVRK